MNFISSSNNENFHRKVISFFKSSHPVRSAHVECSTPVGGSRGTVRPLNYSTIRRFNTQYLYSTLVRQPTDDTQHAEGVLNV